MKKFSIEKQVPTDERLNIYLVENKLKPSAMISLYPGDVSDFKNYQHSLFGKYNFNINKSEIKKFEDYLNLKNIKFIKKGFSKNTLNFGNGEKGTYQIANYLIAKDDNSMKKLINAKSDAERGLALGFPESSIRSYKKIVNGEKRDGTYIPVAMGKAKKVKLKIPPWISYLSFIPSEFDIIHQKFDDNSKEIGERYMDFVRKNNPELAKDVEDEKNNPSIPTSWEKDRDGGYRLYYNNFGSEKLDKPKDLTKHFLAVGAIAGFVFSLFFLSSNLTGNVVGNAGIASNSAAGIIILIASFLLGLLALKK